MEEPSLFRLLRLDGDRVSLKTAQSKMKPCLASIDGGPVPDARTDAAAADATAD